MRDADWEPWGRRLGRILERGPMSLAEARRLYDEMPAEELDEARLQWLVEQTRRAVDGRSGRGRSSRTSGVWTVWEGPVSRQVVGLVERMAMSAAYPATTRIVRTPNDLIAVVDSQTLTGRDVARAMERELVRRPASTREALRRGSLESSPRAGWQETGLESVCIDSHVDAGRAWVVDTCQTTLREFVPSGPAGPRWDRKAG